MQPCRPLLRRCERLLPQRLGDPPAPLRDTGSVRMSGRPSWQVTVDSPQVLAIALYLRDLAGVAQTAPPSELPQAAPSVAAHGTVQAAPEVAAQWNAWWTRALLSAPHRAVPAASRRRPRRRRRHVDGAARARAGVSRPARRAGAARGAAAPCGRVAGVTRGRGWPCGRSSVQRGSDGARRDGPTGRTSGRSHGRTGARVHGRYPPS